MREQSISHENDALRVDFSVEATGREELRRRLLSRASENKQEVITMTGTGRSRLKRSTTIAIAACIALALSVTAYAAVNYFRLGDYVDYIVDGGQAAYGDRLQAETQVFNAAEKDKVSTLFTDKAAAQEYLSFEAKDFGYAPEGYELEGWRIINNPDGSLPTERTDYLSMYFVNQEGDYIYVQARLMSDKTAFAANVSGKAQELTINGSSVVADGHHVDILFEGEGNLLYTINAQTAALDELIMMAESLA